MSPGAAAQTSSGFFDRKIALILTKCVATFIFPIISPGEVSRMESQNGRRSSDDLEVHVSTIDQISLHNTSVAM